MELFNLTDSIVCRNAIDSFGFLPHRWMAAGIRLNVEVGKRFLSAYLQYDGSPDRRSCVGGICCGMHKGTESEGDDRPQDYVTLYFPDNVRSDFPHIDDTLLFEELGDAVYDSWKVALKQKDAMSKRKPSECQCTEVKVAVGYSRTARNCLEKKEVGDSSGKVQRINLNGMNANKRKRWQAVDYL